MSEPTAKIPQPIRLVPLGALPAIGPGDDLAALLCRAAEQADVTFARGVLVVCQKIVSKAEGRLVELAEIEPSQRALQIAEQDGKDARHVEVILRESDRIVRHAHGVMICQTRHGFVCANAGVDLSNAPGPEVAVLLPEDCDASAENLRAALEASGCRDVAVIISDTFGRPWREGLVDVAIGCAGIGPMADVRGQRDWTGRDLQVTITATADQLAAAAGLLMVKNAGVPAVWIEGHLPDGEGHVRQTLRDPASDLFR